MATPLKIVRRLDEITTDYAVFERDQVLTERQLNSITEYLDDQNRLSRTQLLGIGIVGGLWPSLQKGQLAISAGVGVTSDGDLIGLRQDTVFDRWRTYDESAPAYDAFYVEGGMIAVIELLAKEDKREGQPLSALKDALQNQLLIGFMESYENDPDLCTGGDCDNRGRTARNTQRFLLIDQALGLRLFGDSVLQTGAALAAQLPRVRTARPNLGTGNDAKVDISSAEQFASRYRSAAQATFKSLAEAVAILQKALKKNRSADLPDTANWPGLIQRRLDSIAQTAAGIQYLHAHAKDLASAWNALRAALHADNTVLSPSPDAFPKHLLLGPLAEPAALRTGCYPAPWPIRGGSERQRAQQSMALFGALLESFALPQTGAIKITPSRRELAPLAERAIPIYYQTNAGLRALWNRCRMDSGNLEEAWSYHWMPTPETAAPEDPFNADQAATDFYRIEGLLGQNAQSAEIAVQKLVRQRNLPIAVMSALAHNERRWIIRPPLFKKTSLHSLHYLLRQDVANDLKDNIAYNERLIGDIRQAQSSWTSDENLKAKVSGYTFTQYASLTVDYTQPLESAKAKLQATTTELTGTAANPGPLTARSYKQFVTQDKTVSEKLNTAVLSAATAKTSIGQVSRSDMISPLDILAGSKSRLWIDWLGDILKKREDDAKDRLLLSNMLNEHPGLEHAGGVTPGGTFVLVYDDSGKVIGDLMLPYWLDDNDESDFDEPPLTWPDINVRLPKDVLPVKIIKPLDLVFDDFKVTKILPDLKIQENYNLFYQKSLDTFGELVKNKVVTDVRSPGIESKFNDSMMDNMLQHMQDLQAQVQELDRIRKDTGLSESAKRLADSQRQQAEKQLADLVGQAAEYYALDIKENTRNSSNNTVFYQIVEQASGQIKDTAIKNNLKDSLNRSSGKATGVAQKEILNNVRNSI